MITARITFSKKKEPTTTSNMQNKTAIQDIDASLKLYINPDQPSSVIITNIVTIAHGKVLKFAISYAINSSSYEPSVSINGAVKL